MIQLNLKSAGDKTLKVLCLGAHSDDIEIGCGGTILRLREQEHRLPYSMPVQVSSGRLALLTLRR